MRTSWNTYNSLYLVILYHISSSNSNFNSPPKICPTQLIYLATYGLHPYWCIMPRALKRLWIDVHPDQTRLQRYPPSLCRFATLAVTLDVIKYKEALQNISYLDGQILFTGIAVIMMCIVSLIVLQDTCHSARTIWFGWICRSYCQRAI